MDRFIVGTGRCGSTLLSRLLSEHPATLSVFEFFTGLDWGRRFRPGVVTGSEFADLISQEQPFVTMVLRRGYSVPEITYPFGPAARYTRDDGLPWILVSALSRLSDDPDALYDETLAFAASLPHQGLAQHYRQLFGWLAVRMGREIWIERSGSSIDYLGSLHEFFPQARFLHLHRDGPEVALSMREHHAYRLAVTLLYRPEAERHDAPRPGEPDPISRILESRPPPELFGRYWSEQIVRGFEALQRIDPHQLLELRFEDLVSHPADVLQNVGDFFGLGGDEAWVQRAAALVRGVPPTRLGQLALQERERLLDACRPGAERLGRAP